MDHHFNMTEISGTSSVGLLRARTKGAKVHSTAKIGSLSQLVAKNQTASLGGNFSGRSLSQPQPSAAQWLIFHSIMVDPFPILSLTFLFCDQSQQSS
jgi:hypothetical protein